MTFQQKDFEYQDLFAENSYLQDVVNFWVEDSNQATITADLQKFSKRACGELLPLLWKAEKNQPELVQFDHWGRRIDEIVVDPAWEALHAVAAEEGMIAIGYERQSGADSRIHQFLKLMIFHPSSAFYTCPLAMTDGAARVLELEQGPLNEQYFSHLVSRDPKEFWTAGQWMTEKAGGSDVSLSETRVEEQEGRYFLYGTKWFTSAITANMAMALGQTEIAGEKKLSLFLIRIRNEQGKLNNIEVLRLKDKLGTKAMPTAELDLKGAEGFLVGEKGRGVKTIATILNISRLYNAVCATGTIYRLHSLLRDYSKKRKAFGKLLMEHQLHQETLVKTQADTSACVQFVVALAQLLGRTECGQATEKEQAALRLLTPVSKLWTGKKSVWTTSELVEGFGGAGYVEDTQIPRFLRDAQVFPIWEGTTNIMSLDTLRAMSKGAVFAQTMEYIKDLLQPVPDSPARQKLETLADSLAAWVQSHQQYKQAMELGARSLAFALGDLFAGSLLLSFAVKTGKVRDQHLANVFCSQVLFPQFAEKEGRDELNRQALL